MFILWLLEIFGAGGHGHSHDAGNKENEIKDDQNSLNKEKKTIKERARAKLEQIKPTKENAQRLIAYLKSKFE